MSNSESQILVSISGGPAVSIPWAAGMTAQDALELAWGAINNSSKFTFGLQYYGKPLGYMVFMVNETFDSFLSSAAPYFYWEFLVDGVPQTQGIDSVKPNAGQVIAFAYTEYVAEQHAGTLLEAKRVFQTSQMKS